MKHIRASNQIILRVSKLYTSRVSVMAFFKFRNVLCRLLWIMMIGLFISVAYNSIVGNISVFNSRGRRWYSPALIIDILDKQVERNSYPVLVSSFRESPVDVIIRAVYFDNRTRDGHNNATVFLLEVESLILKYNLISGCGVDNHGALSYKVRDCMLNVWLWKLEIFEKEQMTHWCVMLDCFDLPAANSSKAYVTYKHQSPQYVKRGQWVSTTHHIHRTITVESPRLVIFPPTVRYVNPSAKYPFTIAVCRGPVFGLPPMFSEWLRYQKTIGVDHIYLIVEDSFVHENGLEIPEISHGLKQGYISYSVWRSPMEDVRGYYRSQMIATEDCLYNMQGMYDYVLVADTDDFFTPLTEHKSLHYYVDKWCHQNRTCGALNIRWIQRHTECGFKGKIPTDGNVTSVLASDVRHEYDIHGKVNYKTVHRVVSATDIQVHKHGSFLPEFSHVLLPLNKAYVAHVREHQVHEGTRCAQSFSGLNYSVRCVC